MTEPFKEIINRPAIQTIAGIFHHAWPGFAADAFISDSCEGLEDRELKDRVLSVRDALDRHLPDDFDAFARVALAALHPSEDTALDGAVFGPSGLCGFAVWPLTALVARRGLDVPEKALPLLKEMTKRFTAEFDIRPFILKHPDVTFSFLQTWVHDPNRHVRRLVSEGTRPRLPWGIRLAPFVRDPSPLLPLLDSLRDDAEEYVRRSVANNLNDIAKDHPALVSGIARQWLEGGGKNRKRLVRHACRTLIKNGHTETLDAFGYRKIPRARAHIDLHTPVLVYGDSLKFDFALHAACPGQPVMIDYAIHFMKANGRTSPKVFKWKDTRLGPDGSFSAQGKHTIKPITTRTYYNGDHILEIFVNGQSVVSAGFYLEL